MDHVVPNAKRRVIDDTAFVLGCALLWYVMHTRDKYNPIPDVIENRIKLAYENVRNAGNTANPIV